mmetsp:Transcript_79790/g.200779  ORF Transcript_79790/g.200779 Transcript_79790/m.200779 type:complete len:428 (+) Transcript_79790:96-1379(+)
MSSESWTGVVQKNDQTEAELEQESKALAAVEEELRIAEEHVAAAERRYNLARSQVAKELAKPLVDQKPNQSGVHSTSEVTGADADAAETLDSHVQRASKGSKNAGAMTDKEVSRDRWLAKRAAEGRVRDATKRARERLRRGQRDKKFESLDPDALQGDAEVPVNAEPQPATSETSKKRDLSSYASADITAGAQGIADRVKNHPDAADKRTSLVKVLIGGRENVYTFELSDIVVDLKERGLLEPSVCDDLFKLLSETPSAEKSASVPQEEWLAHAQKISNVEPLDKPLKEAETLYLKWLEEKRVATAEAELEAAERKLQAALSQAEARYPQVCNAPSAPSSPERQAVSEPQVDLDEAARLEELHASNPQSSGSKNTSALSEKVVSSQKWEAERGREARAREREVKARGARRTEARDRKMDAADAPNDD